MHEKFVFHGQTTFIDKPRDTVIQNFQNTYLSGDGSDKDKACAQIKDLIELVLSSRDLPPDDKEEAVQALHSVAEQVKEQKGSRLSLKGTLHATAEVISKAADIAAPALGIITAVLKLLGVS
jgi:hypothetical protein